MAYNAFISYSHTVDGALAAALQSALHSFAKPWYKLRALHIFRDQTNLAVNPALWSSIRDALDQSLFFVLLASPEAAASPWVAKEAEYWIGKNGTSRVLIVLTGGTLKWDHLAASFTSEHTNSLPTSLLRSFPEEPLFLDLHWARDGATPLRMREPRFHDAVLAVVRDDGSTQLIDVVNHRPVGYFAPDEQPAAHIELPGDPQSASLDNNSAVSVAFNSSNSMLAAGARDGVAHVWALPGGRELLRLAHGAPVSQVAFHPKANQLVTASDDGHVRIFDVARAAILADFKCPGKLVSASFSPGGDLLAALSSEGAVSVFDPVHRKLLRTLVGGEAAFNLAFSVSGKRLAIASGDFAFVWDVTTGQQVLKATHAASSRTLTPQQWIYNAAITSEGKLLAYAARGDNLAHVWNVETGRQILELKHGSAVAALSFNADGTKLGTGSYDGTARVWELPSGSELERASLVGGAEVVAFSPCGSRFAAGGVEGSVFVSETRRADRLAFFDLPAAVRSVAFSPDGRRFAIGTTSAHSSPLVRIADIGGNILRDIEFHGAPSIDKLFFLDPNDVIAQWSNNLFLIAIDQSSVTPLPNVPGEMRIDPSGKALAVQQD